MHYAIIAQAPAGAAVVPYRLSAGVPERSTQRLAALSIGMMFCVRLADCPLM